MSIIPIASIEDRRLEPYRNLKATSAMRRGRLFVAEGDKLVKRLLRSRMEVHSVLIAEQRLAAGTLDIAPHVSVFVVPEAQLREIVGFKFHRGVLACGVRGAGLTLQNVLAGTEPSSASNIVDRDESSGSIEPQVAPSTVLIVAIDVRDPTNLGTILRTSEAFGVAGVLLAGHCADPFSRRVLRVSMGAPFQLPIIESADLGADLTELRQRWQMVLLAAVAQANGEPLDSCGRADRIAILLGNESSGIDPQWIAACDRQVTIPMNSGADSLNVAVATGIMLYHFCGPSLERSIAAKSKCRV